MKNLNYWYLPQMSPCGTYIMHKKIFYEKQSKSSINKHLQKTNNLR